MQMDVRALASAGVSPAPANLAVTEQSDESTTCLSQGQPNTARTSRLKVGERVRVDTEDGKLPGVI